MTVSRRTIIVALGVLPLAACNTAAPPKTFDLSAARDGLRGAPGTNGQLLVDEPTALQVYDSERIVARSVSQGLTYLKDGQWADRLPRLVQTRIIQTFENSNRFRNVGRTGDAIEADLKLVCEIRAFEADEGKRAARVEVSAKLVDARTGRILRGQLFGGETPVANIDGPGASAALNQSLRAVLVALVDWV